MVPEPLGLRLVFDSRRLPLQFGRQLLEGPVQSLGSIFGKLINGVHALSEKARLRTTEPWSGDSAR